MRHTLMLAYAQFFNDARIKAYVYALLERGVAVDVICLHDTISKSEMVNGVPLNIIFVQKKYQGHSALRYLISYFAFFFKAGWMVTRLHFQKRYRFIHVNNMPDFLVFCALLPRLLGARVILDMHDVMIAGVLTKFSGLKQKVFYAAAWIQSWLSVRCCDAMIFADHSQRDFLFSRGVRHKESRIVLNLPDDRVFHPRAAQPDNKVIQLVYHGSIASRAGLDLAIQAVEIAAKQLTMHFTIIGSGEQRAELEEYCRDHNLSDLVTFRDFIPVEALQEEIEKYDIGVVANRKTLMSEHCMLPVKMMEYLLVGLPVVVSSLYVIREYFSDEMVSYFEPGNVPELAESILQLARRPEMRQAQVEAAKEFFNKYPWTVQKNMYCDFALDAAKEGNSNGV